MSIFDELQREIDKLGHVDKEITSAEAPQQGLASGGKEEYEFYQSQIYTPTDRIQRMGEYEEMALYAEIGSGLDIYADDSTQPNDANRRLVIESNNDDLREELETLFYKKLGMDYKIWEIVRTTCLYGDYFGELILQNDKKGVLGVKGLPPKTMFRVEKDGKLQGFVQVSPNGEPIKFMPFELVHFKLVSTVSTFAPYGTSVLEWARKHWRQLKLMEDAMVVYRITRAPERRVFNIDVGNLPPAQAEAFIERQRQKFRKRAFVNQRTGQIDWKANTIAPDEDFWVPKRNGEGTTIDQLDGAENLGEIDDVKYFKDKIFAALKIPRVWLQDTEGAEERRQNLSQQDIRFARTIERVQAQIIDGLRKIAIVHLMLRGYQKKDLDDFQIKLTPPSKLVEQMMAEIIETQTRAADSLFNFGYPKIQVAKQIFGTSEETWKEGYKIWMKEDSRDSYPYEEEKDKEKETTDDELPSFIQFEKEGGQNSYYRMLSEGEFQGTNPRSNRGLNESLNEKIREVQELYEENKKDSKSKTIV
jgi:hypothetical protein